MKKLCLAFFLCITNICFLSAQITSNTQDVKQKPQQEKSKDSVKKWNLHFQTTYIYQYKPAFHALYSGPNSLQPQDEKQNSLTATLYIGARLWKGAEIYVNPEIAGGSGLSGAFGLAASTNGETFRVGDPAPTLYLGRGYLKQTFALSDKYDGVEDNANQLGGYMPKRYLQLFLGKISLGDIFDVNEYSNSARTQFMNWSLLNNSAWDYAANTRGYAYSFAGVLQLDKMSYRAAIATLPTSANGPTLDFNLNKAYSLNAEADRTYQINKREGHVRLLGYYNVTGMGSYADAMHSLDSNNRPDIISTRKDGQYKVGGGLNIDQQLGDNIGGFARVGWNNGATETWCFTEADQTASLGIDISGKKWYRDEDNLGVAVLANGISKAHRDYLAAGGLGFQLGDGALNYGNEAAAEIYYSYRPTSTDIWISGDYQFVVNPGYNKDRGPVNVFSLRVHVEL